MPLAGAAQPPTYELPETSHSVKRFVVDLLGRDLAPGILPLLPPTLLSIGEGVEINEQWFSSLHGQAVKLVNPHLLVTIPKGKHRVIWLDRDEQDRARSLLRYIGQPETGLMIDLLASYLTNRRPVARAALLDAGATILDVRHEDLMGGPHRCQRVVDGIVDFIGFPLDRAAMVKRAAAAVW